MNESLWAVDSALQEMARATNNRSPLGRKQLVTEGLFLPESRGRRLKRWEGPAVWRTTGGTFQEVLERARSLGREESGVSTSAGLALSARLQVERTGSDAEKARLDIRKGLEQKGGVIWFVFWKHILADTLRRYSVSKALGFRNLWLRVDVWYGHSDLGSSVSAGGYLMSSG